MSKKVIKKKNLKEPVDIRSANGEVGYIPILLKITF